MKSVETLVCPDAPEPYSWPLVEAEIRPRLVFWKLGVQNIRSAALRPTGPEARLYKYQQRLLGRLQDSADGVNVERAKKFISDQGLRVAPHRVLNEAGTQYAKAMGVPTDLGGSYDASYDVALVHRLAQAEEINGPEFSESILVHEFAHGTNEYHDLVYVEDIAYNQREILHGRSGLRTFDPNGAERGRVLEESYAEQQRGKYVEEVLDRPLGFVQGVLNTRYLRQGDAIVAAKYAARRANGEPYIRTHGYGAQALDLLCRVDPGLERDLAQARISVEGLRGVAKRLNRIQPGLYTYMRDLPNQSKYYKQCLLRVQQLVSSAKTKSPVYSG